MLAETITGPWIDATADAVGRAIQEVNRPGPPRRAARWAALMADMLAEFTKHLDTLLRDEIEAGVEVASFVAETVPLATRLNKLCSQLGSMLERLPSQVSESDLQQRIRESLHKSERQLIETQRFIARYIAVARTPLTPIDEESLRRGRADVAEGRTEKMLDAITRLEAGGEL